MVVGCSAPGLAGVAVFHLPRTQHSPPPIHIPTPGVSGWVNPIVVVGHSPSSGALTAIAGRSPTGGLACLDMTTGSIAWSLDFHLPPLNPRANYGVYYVSQLAVAVAGMGQSSASQHAATTTRYSDSQPPLLNTPTSLWWTWSNVNSSSGLIGVEVAGGGGLSARVLYSGWVADGPPASNSGTRESSGATSGKDFGGGSRSKRLFGALGTVGQQALVAYDLPIVISSGSSIVSSDGPGLSPASNSSSTSTTATSWVRLLLVGSQRVAFVANASWTSDSVATLVEVSRSAIGSVAPIITGPASSAVSSAFAVSSTSSPPPLATMIVYHHPLPTAQTAPASTSTSSSPTTAHSFLSSVPATVVNAAAPTSTITALRVPASAYAAQSAAGDSAAPATLAIDFEIDTIGSVWGSPLLISNPANTSQGMLVYVGRDDNVLRGVDPADGR